MKPRNHTFVHAAALGVGLTLVGISQTALAATLNWDPTLSASATGGGSGTWDTTTANWFDGTADIVWTNGNDAVLGGADGTYAVTTGVSVSAAKLLVEADGYTLANDGVSFATVTYNNSTGSSTTPANSALQVAAGKTFNIGSGSDATVFKVNGGNGGYSSQLYLADGAVLNVNAGASVLRDNSPGNGGIRFSSPNGVVNLHGTLSLLQGNDGIRVLEVDSDNVTLNVKDGGLVSVNTTAGNESGASIWIAGGASGSGSGMGTLNIEAGGNVEVLNTDVAFGLSRNPGPSSVLNLAGTLTVPKVINNQTGTINLNGGTFRANVSNPDFMTLGGTAEVKVNAAGGTVDTNGFDITIAQPLLEGGAGGGITKTGAGTLTLSGASSYSGDTEVGAGSLTLADGGSLHFVVGNASANRITGAGSVQIDGSFDIDISGVTSPAASYTLVDASVAYGPTFSVTTPSWSETSAGIWEGNGWRFDTSTGILVSMDSDVDGMDDTWEQQIVDADAGDAITDISQVLPGDDFDGDRATNLMEYTYSSDPTDAASWPDTDMDGVNDGYEDFAFGDNDGIIEPEDLTTATADDNDGDGLPDLFEDQFYGDNDGIVEPSDLSVQDDPDADDDNDNNTNLAEAQAVPPTDPLDDSSWPDTDFDGVNDGWELATFGTLDRANANDTDGDYLDDFWEDEFYGNDDFVVDPSDLTVQNDWTADDDGDGSFNYQESLYYTDPGDPLDFFDLDFDGLGDGHLMLGNDANDPTTTSFNAGVNWEDGNAPVAGQRYTATYRIRTPENTTAGEGGVVFAGDQLSLPSGGILTLKNGNNTTTANLRLAGGSVENGTGNNTPVTLEGTIELVESTFSLFDSPNGGRTITVNSIVSGSGFLNITGNSGPVVFNAANTWTGSISTANPVTIGSTGVFNFVPEEGGDGNSISGSGSLMALGAFDIDTSGAGTTSGDSWQLVDVDGAVTYDAAFVVNGFSDNGASPGSRIWSKVDGSVTFQFSEITGALTSVNGDTDGDGMDDGWEQQIVDADAGDAITGIEGVLPLDDFDGDRTTNLMEYVYGTDPTDPNDWPDTDFDTVNDGYEDFAFGDNDGIIEPSDLTTATAFDTDGDGWDDEFVEDAIFGNNNGIVEPSDLVEAPWTDADGDGATNRQEVDIDFTDPLDGGDFIDFNGDGVADGAYLTGGDANNSATTSWETSGKWSDGFAPLPGINYYVSLEHLRGPYTAGGDYTFGGARLVVDVGGNVLFKSNSNHNFGELVLDGGRIHNGSNGNGLVTVGGNIMVRSASLIYAQNGDLTVNAVVSGSGDLEIVNSGRTVTFTGANTWNGNLAAEANFVLSETGVFNFVCGAGGSGNSITGSANVTLNGTLEIDLDDAGAGESWNLVANSGTRSYGAAFSVSGLVSDGGTPGSRIWSDGTYSFNEASGVLSLGSAPSGFGTWAGSNGLDGSPGRENGAEDNPEGDGYANVLEYQLNGDPLAFDRDLVAMSEDEDYLIFSFERFDDSEADSTLSFRWGSDLDGWAVVPIGAVGSTDGDGVIVAVTEDGGSSSAYDAIEVRLPKSLATDGRLFGQLQGSRP